MLANVVGKIEMSSATRLSFAALSMGLCPSLTCY
jgi:hypothetical protein